MIKKDYDVSYFENWLYKGKKLSRRDLNRSDLIKKIKPGGNLLEIGSGEGFLLNLLKKEYRVVGVEISKYASKLSKKLNPDVELINNKIEDIRLDEGRYDVIVAYNILEHLQNPEKELQKIYRSLKVGGILIGSVPNNFGIIGSTFTLFTNFIDRTHISTYKTEKWVHIFSKVGFNSSFMGEIPLGRNNNLYINKKFWKYVSMNLVFICRKS